MNPSASAGANAGERNHPNSAAACGHPRQRYFLADVPVGGGATASVLALGAMNFASRISTR